MILKILYRGDSKMKKLCIISFFGLIVLGVTALSPIIQEIIEEKRVFPFLVANANITSDMEDWVPLYFDDKQYLEVSNPLFKKEITNHADNDNDIAIRVKDADNNIIINDIIVSPGTSEKLDGLKLNEKYTIEVKALNGRYIIVMW
jgi:hypothetical protein